MNHSLPELFRVCGNQFARTNSTHLGQASVYSSLTSWDEYGWAFPDELCMSSFPNGLPYDEWTVESVHSHFVGSRVYVFPVITCHLHFWQNDRGISQATGVTQRWNGYWTKSQHRKPTQVKKNLLLFLPRIEPATLWSRVWRSTTELYPQKLRERRQPCQHLSACVLR